MDNFDPFYSAEEKRANLASARENPQFQFLDVDITDRKTVEQALGSHRFDVIVHLAAKAGVRPSIHDPVGYARTNVLGTQVILDVGRRLGTRGFIFASSSSVYGDAARAPFREEDPAIQPISPYAATKRAAELLCFSHQQLHGGSVVCLRFFTAYGPRQRPDLAIRKFCSLLLEGRPVSMYGDGSSERDYTWIDDLLAGVLAAVDRTVSVPDEFEIINLGEGRTIQLRKLVALLAEALRVIPIIEQLPKQPGDVRCTRADLSKARRLLHYQPGTPIEEGIIRFVEWFKTRAHARAPG
jgi:UDP-glucuronate 4-epimerase